MRRISGAKNAKFSQLLIYNALIKNLCLINCIFYKNIVPSQHIEQNVLNISYSDILQSHPVWVRELKQSARCLWSSRILSHPVWVRELKQLTNSETARKNVSHPVWVRELKQPLCPCRQLIAGRTLCGCVN